MTYSIDYSGDTPQQTAVPVTEPKSPVGATLGKKPWYKAFRLPSVAVTAAAAVLTTAVWFGVEAYAPEKLTPSYNVGRYEARVEARVDAYKLQQQQKIDRINAQIKLHNDQAQAKFQVQAQAIADNYRANYEMRKLALDGVIKLAQQWQGVRYAQLQRFQAADTSLANMATLLGRLANLGGENAGAPALEWSAQRKQEMLDELRAAGSEDSPVNMAAFGNTNLPTPEEVVAMIEKLRPEPMPLLPNIGEEVALYPSSSGEVSSR